MYVAISKKWCQIGTVTGLGLGLSLEAKVLAQDQELETWSRDEDLYKLDSIARFQTLWNLYQNFWQMTYITSAKVYLRSKCLQAVVVMMIYILAWLYISDFHKLEDDMQMIQQRWTTLQDWWKCMKLQGQQKTMKWLNRTCSPVVLLTPANRQSSVSHGPVVLRLVRATLVIIS